jgi:hypothetical protein
MKIVLNIKAERRVDPCLGSESELLRLALEILEDTCDWPTVDIAKANINHWNGYAITINESDITDAIDRGLLNADGHWTEFGRTYLTRGLEGSQEAMK